MESYSLTRILLHWLTALAIFALFASGFWMVELNYYSEWYTRAPHWHKSVGLVLFALVIPAILWRRISEKPAYDAGVKLWERLMARLVQSLMTLFTLAVIITGYLITTANGDGVSVFNWFDIPAFFGEIKSQADLSGKLHRWTAYALIALAFLHASAALYHHFVKKDRTLLKMLPK